MGKGSGIEWTDHTWNPVIGCRKVSQGCKNCYAERLVERSGKRFIDVRRAKDATFYAPKKWKDPARVFTCSLSDLFIEEADELRQEIFKIMASLPHLTFQVLTKRTERVFSWFTEMSAHSMFDFEWPQNVWLGTSIESQAVLDNRLSDLMWMRPHVPKIFLSCEPLIGPVDLKPWLWKGMVQQPMELIDWVIVGGESGPKARPMHPQWARQIRNDCMDARIPFFFKQWGEWMPHSTIGDDPNPNGKTGMFMADTHEFKTTDWEPGPHMAGAQPMVKVGKKKAGNVLDEMVWQEFPDEGKTYLEL